MTPEELFERFAREPQIVRRVPVSTYRLQLDRTFTLPLETRGSLGACVCAFARVRGAATALTVVPRLYARRSPDERVASPGGVLTLADACASFPVALLARED